VRKYLSLVSILLIVVACSGSGAEGEAIGGENVTVQMFDNRFEYTEINVPVGGTVTFVNAGANPHNAVEANGEWSTEDVFGSLDMFEGDEATLTFDTPGEYVFFCTYHGNSEGEGMAGTLIVGDE
jgi:plastocyanin